VLGVQLVAILIAAYAIFTMGVLWSWREFAQVRPVPGPFLPNFPRYTVSTLWPLPGALLLFLAAGGFGRRWPRWWILFVAATLWFVAYLLVRPPQIYYYWLTPTPS
jgi:hypothetical protein